MTGMSRSGVQGQARARLRHHSCMPAYILMMAVYTVTKSASTCVTSQRHYHASGEGPATSLLITMSSCSLWLVRGATTATSPRTRPRLVCRDTRSAQ